MGPRPLHQQLLTSRTFTLVCTLAIALTIALAVVLRSPQQHMRLQPHHQQRDSTTFIKRAYQLVWNGTGVKLWNGSYMEEEKGLNSPENLRASQGTPTSPSSQLSFNTNTINTHPFNTASQFSSLGALHLFGHNLMVTGASQQTQVPNILTSPKFKSLALVVTTLGIGTIYLDILLKQVLKQSLQNTLFIPSLPANIYSLFVPTHLGPNIRGRGLMSVLHNWVILKRVKEASSSVQAIIQVAFKVTSFQAFEYPANTRESSYLLMPSGTYVTIDTYPGAPYSLGSAPSQFNETSTVSELTKLCVMPPPHFSCSETRGSISRHRPTATTTKTGSILMEHS